MSDTISTTILVEPKLGEYTLYRRRFYVLGIFSLLAFNQCAFWLTFSPVSPSTQTFYGISSNTVDLFLNWGPIIFIPCLPLAYLLMNRKNGLRHTVILLAIACFVATLLRAIPSIVMSASNSRFRSVSLPFLHIGQIINAACGPLVMAPVSQLSCLWFAPNERTRATTFAIMANVFGATASYLINPAIVYRPSNIPYLLYFHLGLATVGCILALIYFPAQPPTAPSAAAQLLMQGAGSSSNRSWKAFFKDLRQCMSSPSFVLLSTAGGVMGGTFATWTGLFSTILAPEHYSEKQAGWFGFGSSLAGILGGFFLGSLVDTRRFQRSLKSFILLAFAGCLISVIWFELSVRSVFYDKPVLGSTSVTIGIALTLAGLFQGAAAPLIYESVAEISYPLPESLSASVLVQWNNVTVVILLLVGSERYQVMNLLVLISIILSIIMVLFVRVTYKRKDQDAYATTDNVELNARVSNSSTVIHG